MSYENGYKISQNLSFKKKMDPSHINEIIGRNGPEEIRVIELEKYFNQGFSEIEIAMGSNLILKNNCLSLNEDKSISITKQNYISSGNRSDRQIIKNRLINLTPIFYQTFKKYGFNINLYNDSTIEYILRYLIKHCGNDLYFQMKNDYNGAHGAFQSINSKLKYICKYGNVGLLENELETFGGIFPKNKDGTRLPQVKDELADHLIHGLIHALINLPKRPCCIDCVEILVSIIEEEDIEIPPTIWQSAIKSKSIIAVSQITRLKFNFESTFNLPTMGSEGMTYIQGNALLIAMFYSFKIFKYMLNNIPILDPNQQCQFEYKSLSLLDLAKEYKKNDEYEYLSEFLKN